MGGPTPTRTGNLAFGVRCFTIETMDPRGHAIRNGRFFKEFGRVRQEKTARAGDFLRDSYFFDSLCVVRFLQFEQNFLSSIFSATDFLLRVLK